MPPRKPAQPRVEDRVRALFDAFQEALLIHDPETGTILDANARASELLARSHEALVAMPLGDLSVGLAPYTGADMLGWIRKAAEGTPQIFDWMAQNSRGKLFWVEMNLHLTTLDGAPRILSTVRDISDRKRLQSDHQARIKRAEAQHVVFQGLAEAGSNFQRALDLIARYMAADIGDLAIVEWMDEAKRLFPRAVDQPYLDGRDVLPQLSSLLTASPPESAPAQVAASGMPCRLEDPKGAQIRAALREEFHPFLWRYNAHSLLSVPLRSQGVALGTLTLVKGSASRPYSQDDQTMLQNLADRAGLALTNAQLFSENLQQAEQLRLANADLEAKVAARTAELEELNQRLKLMATVDALTGLANRRRFDEVMDEEIRRSRRNTDWFSLMMCDVDFFKKYNDHYGHQGGDDCLRVVGEVMRDVVRRAGELPARYGGEEFAVILPGVGAEQALKLAEKLLQALARRKVPHERSDASPFVSMSIGLASARVEAEHGPEWFIAQADAALYQSKQSGRNRVTLASA